MVFICRLFLLQVFTDFLKASALQIMNLIRSSLGLNSVIAIFHSLHLHCPQTRAVAHFLPIVPPKRLNPKIKFEARQ